MPLSISVSKTLHCEVPQSPSHQEMELVGNFPQVIKFIDFGAYVPGGQSVHGSVPEEIFPGGHGSHADTDRKVPGLHEEQGKPGSFGGSATEELEPGLQIKGSLHSQNFVRENGKDNEQSV
jgi:hypothetical protein